MIYIGQEIYYTFSNLFSKIQWNIWQQNNSISPDINPNTVKYMPGSELINIV